MKKLNENTKITLTLGQLKRLVRESVAVEPGKELVRLLPHGSGIDDNWKLEQIDGDTLRVSNAWHYMDGNGYYVGWVPFSVDISRSGDYEVQPFDVKSLAKSDLGKEIVAGEMDSVEDFQEEDFDDSAIEDTLDYIFNGGNGSVSEIIYGAFDTVMSDKKVREVLNNYFNDYD